LSPRRRFTILLALILLLGLGGLRLLWQWKAPGFIERRLDRITGHRTTIGSVGISHRLEFVAYDVRIAGAPPFESQTLARADRVVIRLRGPGGFWTPSAITIDGLDLEYLGTATGDNLRGLAGTGKRSTPAASGVAAAVAPPPWIRAQHARLRGSIALPRGLHLAFRVPEFEFQRGPDGVLDAALHRAVLDVEGLGSLRTNLLEVKHDRERLVLSSKEKAALDVAGGGALFDGLALTASVHASEASFGLHGSDPARRQVVISARWNPQTVEVIADAQDVSLRPLGGITARRGLGLETAKASLYTAVTVDRPNLKAEYTFEAKVGGFALMHPSIDLVPWRDQNAALAIHGSADLATGRIELAGGRLRLLAATLTLDGWVEMSRAPRGSLVLATPRREPLPCAALFLGQPRPVRQALAGLEVDGKLGFTLTTAFDAAAWEGLKLDVTVDPVCSVRRETTALTALLPVLRQPSTPMRVPTKFALGPFHPDFVPLSAMPRHLTGAFLTSEDSKFFKHRGFDLEMIRHALAQDLENRSFQRGASTITQQLAKNLFLSHRRTLARKLEEAVLTWRLQRLLSKDRVLELYLNLIELGPNVRGVKQAAREYFGKEVAALTPLESAHLAALTPNPRALARRFRDGKVDEGWQQRLLDLLGMMKRNGRLSAAELATARSSHLVLRELGAR
jgi:hypothetical protein